MHLLDANVLLYAVNSSAPDHEVARTWLETSLNGDEPVAFAWLAMRAFVRISTRRAIFEHPLTTDGALDFIDGWLGRPQSVVVGPTDRHLALVRSLLADTGTGGNLVSDVHLAALAIEHQATICSFDADFGRFAPRVTLVRPRG